MPESTPEPALPPASPDDAWHRDAGHHRLIDHGQATLSPEAEPGMQPGEQFATY